MLAFDQKKLPRCNYTQVSPAGSGDLKIFVDLKLPVLTPCWEVLEIYFARD